jgi:hypothetical protein
MKDINDLMMESFVEIVNELAESKNMKKNEFAKLVWPESSPRAASSRWQNMRTKVSNTGKPQGVLISDAQRMAGVLGMDIAYLFLQASERARKKEAQASMTKKNTATK